MKDATIENDLSTVNSSISYAELKQHSSYEDAWIAIDGIVYDITDFIPTHPFGDTFRGNLGTDCSGLFSSAHVRTNVENLLKSEHYLRENGIKVVGNLDVSQDNLYRNNDQQYLDRVVYSKLSDDRFWLELKDRVRKYLLENHELPYYSNLEGTIYLIYHSLIFILLSYLTWAHASPLAAILLGFHMVCASAGVSHIVAHFGFTKNKLLNAISLHLMDLGGYSSLEWQISHQTHHNQPHSSIDYQTNQYVPMRIHEYVMYREHHKYQYIYFWIGILFYHLRIFPMSTIWIFSHPEFVRYPYEIFAHLLAKAIFLTPVIYCGYCYGIWRALILFSVYSIAYSFFAFMLLYNDHEENHKVLALNENINPLQGKFSWAEVQVRTSGDWIPSHWLLSFIEFHYGYFNFHIEHHLFPSFKPTLLKKISPIVKEVCDRHNIPYISTTFIEMHKSFQHHITEMGLSQDN